jgi:hypothetical protein
MTRLFVALGIVAVLVLLGSLRAIYFWSVAS